MNLKDFEQDYIKFTDSSVPDTEKLWEKISSAPDSDTETDITPFLSASEQCRASGRSGNVIKLFAAVAAVFIAVFGINVIMPTDNNISYSDKSVHDTGAACENFAEAEDSSDMYDFPKVSSETGWDYRTGYSENESYLTLNLADTDSGIYNALSNAPAENEYFVEADVLRKTDFFIDGRVLSSRQLDDCVLYTLEVIHLISGSDMTVPETLEVRSSSPYALRNNREYLLPVSEDNGEYTVVFDNAPQIEFTNDREIVYHNGWQSLSQSCLAIEYPKVYKDDYFYDRMNITAECSLQNLFDMWEKYKA